MKAQSGVGEKVAGCLAFAVFGIAVALSVAIAGVGIWAVVRIVLHLTGGA